MRDYRFDLCATTVTTCARRPSTAAVR